MSPVSFTAKLIKSGAIPIHLVRATETSGKDCYFFVICSQQKSAALKTVKDKEGVFNINDYGNVIASGYGHTPSQADIDMIKEKYNFDATQLI